MGKEKAKNDRIRYNILTILVYIVGIVLLAQLFNLQIVHGEEYRETSNTKLTRESVLKADRGSIKDSSGTMLASVDAQYSIVLYKTKVNNETLNTTILKLLNILSTNSDSYVDNFLIDVNPYRFKLEEEESQKKWKKANNINEDATAEEAFNYFKNKYDIASDNVEVQGVVLEEEYDEENEIRLTRVVIETENGAKIMGKPTGIYLTLESPDLALEVEENSRVLQERICDCIRELIFHKISCEDGKELKILFVGLGNRAVTPDALGPYVADHLEVNRHIVKEYGKYAMRTEQLIVLSAIVPGVMGQTGMETAEIVRGIVHETKPDLILAVDALAARNSRRLNRTIQIADTGIHPGSGVGNYRNAMTEESLGVPVIGIGVPTVVDAATIVNDTMENFITALEQSQALRSTGEILRSYSAAEKYEFVKELISPHLNGMFVTPKDVDEMVHQISHTIAASLNLLFSDINAGESE